MIYNKLSTKLITTEFILTFYVSTVTQDASTPYIIVGPPHTYWNQHYNKLTLFERGRTVVEHETRFSFRETARRLVLSNSSIIQV